MNAAFLLALIHEVAMPELDRWLRARAAAKTPITEADILMKLLSDTDFGERIGEAWLASHPATPPPPAPALAINTL